MSAKTSSILTAATTVPMEVIEVVEDVEYEGLPPNAGLGVRAEASVFCAMSADLAENYRST